MGWPNNYVQGVYDSDNNLVGVDDGNGGSVGLMQYGVNTPWSLLKKVLPYITSIASWISSSLLTTSGQRPFPTLPWKISTAYSVGAVRSNSGNLYVCITAGTSAGAGGPTTTLSSIADNTVTWRYIKADPLAWAISTAYSFGDMRTNLGFLYICTVAGTSAGATGPNANNTAVVDNTVTWCRVQQQWIDSINGLDANDGLTPITPKKSMPTNLSSNTHYWIFAGSSFSYDVTATNGIGVNATRTSMTVVTRTNFNEITAQPNPFLRALVGQWYNTDDVSNYYFSLIGNGPSLNDSDIAINSAGIVGTTSSTLFKVRGAYIYGFPYAGIVAQAGGYWDVSDCIIKSCKQIQTVAAENAGSGIRMEGASSTGSHNFSRLFISDSGEDAIWSSVAAQAKDWQLTDCAIHHKPTLTASSSHADAIQFSSYPGAAKIQRVIVEHDLSNVSNSDGLSPIGSAIIQDATGTVGTENWEISDCIFVSNNNVTNFQRASTGTGFNRCIFGLVGNVPVNDILRLHNANAAWTISNSVNYIEAGENKFVTTYTGNIPTKTNLLELTG